MVTGLFSGLAIAPDGKGPASSRGAASGERAAAGVASARPGARYAYVTLLTKDAYLPGVLALHRSLRLVRARHELIVLHTAGVASAALDALRREGGMRLRFTEQFETDGAGGRLLVRLCLQLSGPLAGY